MTKIGEALAHKARYAEALTVLRQALDLAEGCDDLRLQARLLERMGRVFSTVELHGHAAAAWLRGHKIFSALEEMPDAERLARALRRTEETLDRLRRELRDAERELASLEAAAPDREARRRIRVLRTLRGNLLRRLDPEAEEFTLGAKETAGIS